MMMTANEKRRPATNAQRTVPERSRREKAIDILEVLEAVWRRDFSEVQGLFTPQAPGGAMGNAMVVEDADSGAASKARVSALPSSLNR
jgi:hypothetical protein